MSSYKSEFLSVMAARGYIHQCTDDAALDAAANEGTITAYIGFDCTAPSLHVGHLIGIMMLRRLQKAGHRPIVLIGGGTTKVGDPSGKDETRKILSDEDIANNIKGIQRVFSRFLTFGDGPQDAMLVNNADWLENLQYIDFLREYGRHFTINRMMSFDSVKLRLDREQPLTFLEFNYMILQAYDFLELNRRVDCVLQMGGSDQWGNIVNGIELARRVDGSEVYGLTTPLLMAASGAKMGKSAQGAVWLDPDMLSPYEYWQYWRNTEDADVGRFLRLFTEVPDDEIQRLETLQGAELNDAKKRLATEATTLVHGQEAANEAADTARQTFEQGATADGLPSIDVPRSEIESGMGVLTALVKSGLASSNSEARRHIKGGAARVNDAQISDERAELSTSDLTDTDVIKLSVGKKRHALLRAT